MKCSKWAIVMVSPFRPSVSKHHNLWPEVAKPEAGGVYVNGMTASHPAFPFGGVKRSGYGRELSGHGIREFCNITTVWQGV